MNKIQEEDFKIKVGITSGDFNGIGYEIIIKSLADQRICELFTPIVYGTSKAASYHRKALTISDFNFNIIRKAEQANSKKPNIVNIKDEEVKIDLGLPTVEGGELAYLALEAAVEDLRRNHINVLVTAPISKHAIRKAGFEFPGHTEYLASRFEAPDYLMIMVSGKMRLGIVTGHIPIRQVAEKLSRELVMKKARTLHDSLIRDFNINKPKVAVLGLNPHAGKNGMIGEEENNFISPVVHEMSQEGKLVYGPFPADGFFGSGKHTEFDGILAMYHDQGMLPFKTLSFNSGVNFTAGLPIIRTSPAHGTAFGLAGKNNASPDSFREALYMACDIFRNRMLYEELTSNPLVNDRDSRDDATET
jgi:4-hydroxythreonine-4-phosphate dehydrogenase